MIIQTKNMMRTGLFYFLLFVLGSTTAGAQSRSFGTLPLAQKPKASQQEGLSMSDSPKYQKALEVYNRLVAARGDFRYPVPAFSMRKEERRVAGMDYDQLEITLEEKAFDVCETYGDKADAALAFLLGHELTHYYEKHAWRRGFVSDFKGLKIAMKLDSLIDDAANETQADYLGGFLAYSAGYGLFDKGPEVIKKLYDAYNLPASLPGYPSLADRQTLGQRTEEKLQRLVEVFDMANLLTAVGKYSEAYEYYRFVLMEYQSREIYNNLGVTAVLDALQYFKEGELKFRYPVELDLESSATKGSGMVDARSKLLQQALLHFDAAISLDPHYAPAYLNKACVYALMGDVKRAQFYAEEEAGPAAHQYNYPKTALDVDVLSGILEAGKGNTDKAKEIFGTAAAAGSALAAINLKLLNNEALETEPTGMVGLLKAEKIDDQALALIADDAKFEPKKSITLSKTLTFHQNSKQGPNSFLYVSQNSQTEVNTFFHVTGPDYTGKTARQIGLGDNRAAIVKAYGEPLRTVETPQGQMMVYKKTIFILGAKGVLKRWVNYIL